MRIHGILFEGRDGQEYLLGLERDPDGQLTGPPPLSRRAPNGGFTQFDDVREASKVVVAHLGPRGVHVIGPSWGQHAFLWALFADALKALPTAPTWPTWEPS
jgi:hypothetical protein